ncbi:zinc finger MYM-type protein 1-like [Hydra vulgaris]|uniref:Zinc finger MYM-type protein 1-like n=1 Tax=Hydra vulgaris TaxID=6087 RepID=A0ABM4DFS3_HYDVU
MDQKRHISGAQARKRVIFKKEKEVILLSKIPGLNNFFKQINNITPSCVEDNKLESSNDTTITNNCSTTSTSIQCTASSSDQSVVDVNEESEKSELNVILNPLTQNNTNNFKDPVDWTNSNICRNYIAKFRYDQNIDADFTSSKQSCSDYDRYCSKSIFTKNRKNGENVSRKWLVYSILKFVLFCTPCKLFGCSTQLGDAGFNDWKNGHLLISRHENFLAHKNNTLSFITLQSDVGRIDTQLATQATDEMSYWKAVLHRIVEVIKFLGAKGLSFRGDNEQFNKINKGNFLGTLELFAKFDPSIAQHIEKYGNRGKGTPSYLSSTIYEELLLLMKNDIIKIILKELKAAKYYSLIVDSTPDIANVDQLVIALRYVLPSGVPAKRFLIFISNSGHKSKEMSNVVMDFLNSHNIPIENCRGQSYDNARNMSGQYSGLQSRIKSFNSFAEYVPCSAHSLNLGSERVQQKVKNLSVKNLSVTRWSARFDACHALFNYYEFIIEALHSIVDNQKEKAVYKVEANGFNATNKKLQSTDIDLHTVLDLYNGLENYLVQIRDDFDVFENKAVEITDCSEYAKDSKRKKKRKAMADESRSQPLTEITGKIDFIRNVYYVIIDTLKCQLSSRRQAYEIISDIYGCIPTLYKTPSSIVIRNTCETLTKYFIDDVENSSLLIDECILFSKLISTDKNVKSVLSMYKYIKTKELECMFPNLEVVMRMYLSTAVSNCSGERAFSVLKRVKPYLRSTMKEERLNALAIFSIEAELIEKLDFNDTINTFAHQKARKRKV